MKKVCYFMVVAMIATGCATGYYAPHNINQFGAQTQVVLSQANFRIVRNIEVVIDVNNSYLKRKDVEKSAYAELVRHANLTGSQALINVVIEEVRRESTNIFRVLFAGGIRKYTQHVAARATVIEFIGENGAPIHSIVPQEPSSMEQKTVSEHSQVESMKELEAKELPQKQETPVTQIPTAQLQNKIIIPDKNFKRYLINKFDVDNSGEISRYEALQVKNIYLKTKDNVSDLTGIEEFKNLKYFSSVNNYLGIVDFSNCTKLKEVYIYPTENVKKVIFPKFPEEKEVVTNIPKDKIEYK